MRARLERLSLHLPGRMALALGAFLLAAVPYPLLNAGLAPRFDLSTPLDAAIPFLPWTVALYWSWLGLVALALAGLRGRAFLGLLGALLAAALCCYAGFLLLTAHHPRPAPETIASPALRQAFEWLHWLDGPGNTFPSLHVALTSLAALRMRASPRGLLWLTVAALVALSTLTTKQHVLADVLGGLLVAVAIDRLARRREPAP